MAQITGSRVIAGYESGATAVSAVVFPHSTEPGSVARPHVSAQSSRQTLVVFEHGR